MSSEPIEHLKQLLRPNATWCVMLSSLVLCSLGVAAIGTVEPDYAVLQGRKWLPIALMVMIICTLPQPKLIGKASYPLMWLILAVLMYLLLPGAPLVPRINGATSWINVPGLMRIQPSELAKVIFILALARYLRYGSSYRTLFGLLVPFVIMLVPVLLIYQQPDLGTAMVFGPVLLAMLVAAGAKLRHLGGLMAIAATAMAVVVVISLWAPEPLQVLKPHQRQRIVSAISMAQGQTRYIDDEGYQANKAMMLIGAGGITGYGAVKSQVIVRYNTLPHDHTDMIFAVIVNRWGLVGAWGTAALYWLLVFSIMMVAARTKDPFARLACVGFAATIFTQMVINIGMHVGLLPITGITLPLVSYGGSSLLATFAMIGLTLNFASRRARVIGRPSFEFDRPKTYRAPRAIGGIGQVVSGIRREL